MHRTNKHNYEKILLNAVAAVFAMGVSDGQEIDFEVKVGVNFAKLQGDAVEDLDAINGINVGITGEYMFNEIFALQVEVLYSQQGLESEITFAGHTIEQKLKLDYTNVPVLAKFYTGESGFSVEDGPQIGFLVSDKFEVNGENVDQKS
ncbi:porin family protein [uncultured Nonlabens sp.]|uniref:porin family protein n=1 Tax=uncultured Nonlabens sp. TaxID=859306 RepID=UPI002609CD28|nr:porin family protein [uncultured Nonlabens sp.]